MKYFILFIFIPAFILSSCGGAETKADHSPINVDTVKLINGVGNSQEKFNELVICSWMVNIA